MASKILEFGLLLNDDFALVVAHEQLKMKPRSKPAIFSLETYDESRCKEDFRFFKTDIYRLKAAMGIPNRMETSNGKKFTGTEGLCLLLRRLAYPNRLIDLVIIFGRCRADLSHIFNHMLYYVYDRFSECVTSTNQWWFEKEALQTYATAVKDKGSPLDGCFGFIDGTHHHTCRPSINQMEAFSGHKRCHGLKYQSIVIPNGLIANLYGPEPGRRHDAFMLKRSGILGKLDEIIGADTLYLYGDSGYPLRGKLITPHLGSNLTVEKKAFNETMSKLRICVEWEFGELFEQFAFLGYKNNQKINLQPVGKYMIVATILKNCQACLYGNQTSIYFNVPPPSLEGYLHNNRQL